MFRKSQFRVAWNGLVSNCMGSCQTSMETCTDKSMFFWRYYLFYLQTVLWNVIDSKMFKNVIVWYDRGLKKKLLVGMLHLTRKKISVSFDVCVLSKKARNLVSLVRKLFVDFDFPKTLWAYSLGFKEQLCWKHRRDTSTSPYIFFQTKIKLRDYCLCQSKSRWCLRQTCSLKHKL